MSTLHKPRTLHALWPVRSPYKVLPQAGLPIVRANRGLHILCQSVSGFPRVVKKQPSSHLTPWRVDCINSARETILYLGTAMITCLKLLQVELSLPPIPAPVITLVDSGSSDCFVDSVLVSRYRLPCQKINPLPLTLIDGTINHLVNRVVSLSIRFPCSYSCQIEFFMTKLEGTYPIILGHNWLTQHNCKGISLEVCLVTWVGSHLRAAISLIAFSLSPTFPSVSYCVISLYLILDYVWLLVRYHENSALTV